MTTTAILQANTVAFDGQKELEQVEEGIFIKH